MPNAINTAEKFKETIHEGHIERFLTYLAESENVDFLIDFDHTEEDLYPNNTRILNKMPAKYARQVTLLKSATLSERGVILESILTQLSEDEEHYTYPEIALKLISLAASSKTHPVTQYCKIRAAMAKRTGLTYKNLPNPANKYSQDILASSYVPAKANLNKNLRLFKNGELLTIFPEAEQELFSLAIGRGLYGINGDTFADGKQALSSPWRYACFVTGDPGLGKSILMDSIREAAETLNYTTSEFNTLGKQFGLADIITKNFAFSDDLKANTLQAVLTSDSFKSIVSGAKIRTEQKFAKEFETQSRAVIIANINKFPSNMLYSLDEGVLNRIKVLQCKSSNEISEQDKTYFKIKELCIKYSCTKQELFNAFFRNCVDLYLAELEAGRLRETISALTSKLKYAVPVNVHQSFAEVLQIAHVTANPQQIIISGLNGASFRDSIKTLLWFASSEECFEARNLLKANWELHNRSNEHCWIIFKSLDLAGLAEAAMLANNINDLECGNLNKILKQLLETIRFTDGFKVAALQDDIANAWSDSKFNLRRKYRPLIEQLEELNLVPKEPIDYLKCLRADFNREAEAKRLTKLFAK